MFVNDVMIVVISHIFHNITCILPHVKNVLHGYARLVVDKKKLTPFILCHFVKKNVNIMFIYANIKYYVCFREK